MNAIFLYWVGNNEMSCCARDNIMRGWRDRYFGDLHSFVQWEEQVHGLPHLAPGYATELVHVDCSVADSLWGDW